MGGPCHDSHPTHSLHGATSKDADVANLGASSVYRKRRLAKAMVMIGRGTYRLTFERMLCSWKRCHEGAGVGEGVQRGESSVLGGSPLTNCPNVFHTRQNVGYGYRSEPTAKYIGAQTLLLVEDILRIGQRYKNGALLALF